MAKDFFQRSALLLGDPVLARAAATHVILFGVGGVGSWCAESLVRSGIGALTLVDPDLVCPSNVNRQLMATSSSLGRPKAEVLRERLLDINPDAQITVSTERYCPDTADSFPLEAYDFILDCIDSRHDKMLLIEKALNSGRPFFSSMGAALKLDPTQVRICDFWHVEGDPLARSLRKQLRRQGRVPEIPFPAVCSAELPREGREDGVNGSLVTVTAAFGLAMASLVLRHLAGLMDQ